MGALIPYFGGKTRLAKTIISKFPDHQCYVEVFAGGASVFFTKESSRTEVLNDLDINLNTLYRVVKHHPEEFYRQFKFSLISRSEFNRQLKENPDTLTDIQRAARYLYLQKSAFGGKVTGQTWGTATTGKPRLNLFTLQTTIEQAWERLANVYIEGLDFRQLIPKYDRRHTLFFLDPPYWKIPGYNHDFTEHDFHDMAEILCSIKGKFLMTINDTPEVQDIFKGFNIDEVQLKYSVAKGKKARGKMRTELLISN